MLAGRWRAFEDAPNKRSLFLRTLGVAGLLFLALLAMRLYLIPQLGAPLEADAARLLHPWENLFYTAAFVSAAVLLFTHPGLPLPTRLLSSAGKCTLTCYVTQTLVFTFLFFGWGLGLAQDMGPWPCLCAAVAVFLLQAWACPPLAKPFPVRPPGMALAHRHHVPHAAFLQTDVQRKLRYYSPSSRSIPISPNVGGIERIASCVRPGIKPFLPFRK